MQPHLGKSLSFLFALGAAATAPATVLDFATTGTMFYEDHSLGTDFGDFHNFDQIEVDFQNTSGRVQIYQNWTEVSSGSTGFSYEIYSQSFGQSITHFAREAWSRGHGTIVSTISVNRSGLYQIFAKTFQESIFETRPYLHEMKRADGTAIFRHETPSEFREIVFLEAGNYSTEVTYDSFPVAHPYGEFNTMLFRYSMQAVPEPCSMLALGAGLAWFCRRRKLTR